MTKSLSGTNDTGRGHGCPCGRSHPPQGKFRLRQPKRSDYATMRDRIYLARADGKASPGQGPGEHIVHYAGDCEAPIELRKAADPIHYGGFLHVTWRVRCRSCGPCRRAKVAYWALAAVEQTRLAAEQGRRTWFGTLTLRPESQRRLLELAEVKWLEKKAKSAFGEASSEDWWSDPHCDFRFSLVRDEFRREVQLYWKRLRKAGYRFKYLLVFERHKSGLPHAHWLLHEQADPILKRHLQAQWPHGFSNVKLVRENSDRSRRSPNRAAWYVAKYLGKTIQARQIASRGYRPSQRRMCEMRP